VCVHEGMLGMLWRLLIECVHEGMLGMLWRLLIVCSRGNAGNVVEVVDCVFTRECWECCGGC